MSPELITAALAFLAAVVWAVRAEARGKDNTRRIESLEKQALEREKALERKLDVLTEQIGALREEIAHLMGRLGEKS